MREITGTDKVIQEEVEDKRRGVLQSIARHGLCTLKDVPPDVLPTPAVQSQRVQGNICVNYVDLSGFALDDPMVETTLKVAVFEEYCGLHGIALERQWPFEDSNTPQPEEEVIARLMAAVVFILEPPTHPYDFQDPEDNEPTHTKYYELTDTVSQASARGKDLLSDNMMGKNSRHITEIKTIKRFTSSDILAILAPEALVPMVKEIFIQTPVLSVPSITQRLVSLPEILMLMHREEIKSPIEVKLPDFYSVLKQWSEDAKKREFSLHLVRLHTCFDFVPRPVANLTENEALLTAVQARVIEQHDQYAWVIVHKIFGQSKKKVMDNLRYFNIKPEILSTVKEGSQPSMDLFDRLSAAKADLQFNVIKKALTEHQRALLAAGGVGLLAHRGKMYIYFPSKDAARVTKIIDKFDQDIKRLQAVGRAALSRRCFHRFFKAHQALKEAEVALSKFEVKVS